MLHPRRPPQQTDPPLNRRIGIAGLIWTASILASRVIGLVRERVLGQSLGMSADADAYRASFTVPDTFVYLLAGGALSVVMIPLLSAHLEKGDEARAWRCFSIIANFLVVLMAVVLPVLWLTMPQLAPLVAPGFTPAQTTLLIHLSRIVLPASIFHLLGGLLQAALLARDKHGIPALSPLVYNACVIAGGVLGRSVEGFAWGVLVGAVLGPFLLPLLACLRTGMRWAPILSVSDPDFVTWITRSLPVMLGWSIVGMDDYVLSHFGSKLEAGHVALLGYAKQLMRVPMGVFGSAMAYAAYPTLTRLCLEGKTSEAWTMISEATRQVLVLAFASQVVLTVAGPELGTLVYTTTRIAPERMNELGACLGLFSLALGGWSAQVVLARGFYARGKVWMPTWLGFGVLVLALPAYALLGERFGAYGLAAASTIGISVYVLLLGAILRRELRGEAAFGVFLLKAGAATALGVVAGLAVRAALPPATWGFGDALWRTVALSTVGGLAFLGVAWSLKLEGLQASLAPITRRITRRFGRPAPTSAP